MKKGTFSFFILLFIIVLTGCAVNNTDTDEIHTGQIFLYGEEHAKDDILKKELELWSAYYHDDGMRDLFEELPYYSAEFLNVWMRSDNDEILNQLFRDWEGTAMHSQAAIDFYKQIKAECPETVFHGIDVGHQYDSTGERYLAYLRENGYSEDAKEYRLTQEAMEQGRHYYRQFDGVYRENTMAENFIREFDALPGVDIMGIFGAAHTGIDAMDYTTHTVPCMANQLSERYGETLHSVDLTLIQEAYRVETIEVGEKKYTASYFGEQDISSFLPDYLYRRFWRLENAYDDFKDCLTTGDVLPYNNYPMEIQTGQVFLIEYTKKDGTAKMCLTRADGNTWEGLPVTEEFSTDE